MDQEKINGIRLNKNYTLMTQTNVIGTGSRENHLFAVLADLGINLVVAGSSVVGDHPFVTGVISLKDSAQKVSGAALGTDHPDVCTVSIYPHHFRLGFLGFLLSLLGRQRMAFHHMVSSNSMLTFVIDRQGCDTLIGLLAAGYHLPGSHTPFEQEENDELTQFLKKRYPETRACYVEKRIKTYGMTLTEDLKLSFGLFAFDELARAGQEIISLAGKEDRFFYAAAHAGINEGIELFLLTEATKQVPAPQTCTAELLSFQGPHFGDRHSIIGRAMACLTQKSIPVLLTGCTGAHISLVLPRGRGSEAKQALTEVFESP